MGQNTSFDFRAGTVRLCKEDVSRHDHNEWKALFLTQMEPHEVAMYLPLNDVRYMRVYRPNNLATLIYKCVEQLRFATADVAQPPATGSTTIHNAGRRVAPSVPEPFAETPPIAAKKSWAAKIAGGKKDIIDFCSARNALRMLAVVIPVLYEQYDPSITRGETREDKMNKSMGRTKPLMEPSVFGEKVVDHILWKNRTCEGNDIHGSPVFEGCEQPLGEELMQLLLSSCFIPGFTVGWNQKYTPPPPAASTTQDDEEQDVLKSVISDLLWYGGLCTDKHSKLAKQSTYRQNRIEVMRCIIAVCSPTVFTNDVLGSNPMLNVLCDSTKCPLVNTLVCSLINASVLHQSRGMMPYSSYYFANDAECALALCLQLLGVILTEEKPEGRKRPVDIVKTTPEKGPRPGSEEREEAPLVDFSAGETTAPWLFFHAASNRDLARKGIFQGLIRIIENPCFSANTLINGSQKIVGCFPEALVIMARLMVIPSFREEVGLAAQRVSYALLFFVQEAKADYGFFGAAQSALMIMLSLTTEPTFVRQLPGAVPPKQPLHILPTLPRSTLGDVLLLMICACISPSAPRYMSCFHETLGVMLCNLTPECVSLSEMTCFELHHMLDFVTTEKFLRRGPGYQKCCALVVEALTTLLVYQGQGAKHFAASLGVSTAPKRLRALIEGNDTALAELAAADHALDAKQMEAAHLSMEEAEEMKAKPHVHKWQGFDANLAPTRYATLLEMQAERAKAAIESAGAYADLALPEEMLRTERVVRRYDIGSDAAVLWLMGFAWGNISRHNINPPLFDPEKAAIFQLG